MKSRGWAGALAMISTLSCVDPVIAATVKNITSKDGRVIILISGEIAQGDADLLKAAIKNANDAGNYVSGFG